jgi:hypothetical protein
MSNFEIASMFMAVSNIEIDHGQTRTTRTFTLFRRGFPKTNRVLEKPPCRGFYQPLWGGN